MERRVSYFFVHKYYKHQLPTPIPLCNNYFDNQK
jgi:hypothetical protein